MVTREKLYTAEEFYEIAELPENVARRLELEDGIIVEMPPSSPIVHAILNEPKWKI